VPAADRDEDRQLTLLTQMGFPQLVARDLREALPEVVLAGPGVETVEVGVEVAPEQFDDRLAHPRRTVDAVRHGLDPIVLDAVPGRVRGRGVELAHRVRAVRHPQLNAVMSN
jgi:hypothetical protein